MWQMLNASGDMSYLFRWVKLNLLRKLNEEKGKELKYFKLR